MSLPLGIVSISELPASSSQHEHLMNASYHHRWTSMCRSECRGTDPETCGASAGHIEMPHGGTAGEHQ